MLHERSPIGSLRRAALCLCAALLAGCATPPPPPPPLPSAPALPQRAIVSDQPMPQDIAARAVGADLVSQLRIAIARAPGGTPPEASPDSVVAEPFIDAQSGYGTRAGLRLRDAVAAALLEGRPGLRTAALTPATLAQTRLVMIGSIAVEPRADLRRHRLHVALVEARTGEVAAQSSAWLADRDLDMAALPAYPDSPLLLDDRATRALVALSRTPAGQQADAAWLAQLPAQAALAAALEASSSGEDARRVLALYRQAAGLSDGRSLRALSGLYVTQIRMGNPANAERAFGELVAAALAQDDLSVRFPFAVDSADFLADARLARQYRAWLRQIAQHVARSRICVEIQAHGSRSGDARRDDRLPMRRAEAVRRLMQQEVPAAAPFIRAVGWDGRDSLVASGTDDARDAIDRRVDFRLAGCTPR